MSDIPTVNWPTHLILVLNRDTHELKLVSAHLAGEAQAAFENLSSLFANTANDVHKVTVPSDCGFVIGEIVSSRGQVTPSFAVMTGISTEPGAINVADPKSGDPVSYVAVTTKNGITKNSKGEYVQRLPDGSEIISSSDFGDD